MSLQAFVKEVKFSSKGTYLYTSLDNGQITAHPLNAPFSSDSLNASHMIKEPAPIYEIDTLNDDMLITAPKDQSVHLWKVEEGKGFEK
jgi:hypothetical protein